MRTKILIVEDEIVLALNLAEGLEAVGYEVTDTVVSGEAAIAAAESNRPDLILMDIRLTGKLDGIQAATIVRSRFDIPAVYTTAHNDRDTLELAKISKPYGYIVKPFEIQELVSTIEISLYKHGLEAQLKERERWLASTLRSIGDAVIATDLGSRILFMNTIAETLTGWPQEEALGKELPEVFIIIDAITLQDKENPTAKVLRDGSIVDLGRSLVLARDGIKIPIEDSAAPITDEAGNITGAVLVFRERSDRQKEEEKLRQSERRWRGIFNRAFNFIWLLQLDGTLEEANQTALDFAGIRAEDVIGHPFWEWPWWLAADFRPDASESQYLAISRIQEELKEAIARAANGETVRYDLEILAPESTEMTVDFSIQPVVAEGRGLFLIAEGRDITARKQIERNRQERGEELECKVQERTAELQAAVQQLKAEIKERKRAEAELQQSEERFRNLVETTSDLVWEADENGAYTYISPKVRDLLGYEPSEMLGKTWFELVDTSQVRAIMAVREPFQCLEKITRHKDGRKIVMETSAIPFFDNRGSFRGYRGIVRDISDRQQAIEALRESEEKFRRVFEEAPIGMNLTDSSGRYIQANPAFCKMLGYTEEELKGQNCLSFIHPEDIRREIPYMQRRWQGKNNTYRMEKRYIQKSGEIIWTKMTAGSIRDGTGNPSYGLAMVEDISDRKQVEQALQTANEQLQAVLDAVPGLVAWIAKTGGYGGRLQYLGVNQHLAETFKLAPEEFVGREVGFLESNDDFAELMRQFFAAPQGQISQEIAIAVGGQLRSYLVAAQKYNRDRSAVAVGIDISDRKQAEARLQASLEEKEVLLWEIHHRVKNNLHVISNLLDLQSDYTEDEGVKTILLESQNRIYAMAKVHQQLCESKNLARVNLTEYIDNLVKNLLSVHNANPGQLQVVLQLEPVAVNLETAIPCGLLINELVTNSLKYAFPEGQLGEILIQLHSGQEQKIHLIIGDNGIGIPEKVDWRETNTLGLRLTKILGRQLKAAIELDRSKGTCFRFAFSELQYKARL